MICSESVLVIAIVDSDLDRNTGIDQTNHRGWNADVVGVSSICRTCKTGNG